MSDTAVVINTAVAIISVVVMIVRFKLNPVVSLVVGSAYLGLAVGLGVEETIEAITKGFGDIMAEVGLLIAFGVLMGAILQQTGAIQRLVQTLLKLFGPKRMPYAMSLTIATLLQSIFLDVLLVISAPLARSLAKKIGKNGTARMAAAMAIGLECGIVLTVPGVGALALAGLLGVPLGKMLLFGVLLVIPTVAIAVAIMSFLFNHGWWNPERDEQEFLGADPEPLDDEDGDSSGATTRSDDDTASGGGVATKTATVTRAQTPLIVLFAPMLVSLVLIATGAILDAADIHSPIVKFVSAPVIALLIGLIGTSFVGRYALGAEPIQHAIATGFKESGQILILTGVGGSLAATIKAAGLGDILGEYFTASTAAPLLVVWAIAAALHVAVGSVTISAITSAGILAPVAPIIGLDPVLIALAAGAGSLFAVHVTSTAAPLLMVWAIAAALHVAVGSVTISAITSAGILAPVAPIIGLDPVLIALAAGAGSLFAVHVTSNTFWLLQSLLGQSTRGTLKTVTMGVSVASVVAILLILPMSVLF